MQIKTLLPPRHSENNASVFILVLWKVLQSVFRMVDCDSLMFCLCDCCFYVFGSGSLMIKNFYSSL